MSADELEPDEDRMQARRQWLKRLDELAAELASERTSEPSKLTDQGGSMPGSPERKVIAKPGSHYARLAFENGDDDEYSNAMKRRYGGEW